MMVVYASFGVYHATCYMPLMQNNPPPNYPLFYFLFWPIFNLWIDNILWWIISIFGVKVKIQEAVNHTEDFSVNLSVYKQYTSLSFYFTQYVYKCIT